MSCAAPAGGVTTDGVDLAKETVICGVVSAAGEPLGGAYVRLLDATGEFTAEVPTDDAGRFRFFAAPGDWTLRTLAAGSQPVDNTVAATHGTVTEVNVTV